MNTSLDKILLLRNSLLYEPAFSFEQSEIKNYVEEIFLLGELVLQFRKKYGWGRTITTLQMSLMK